MREATGWGLHILLTMRYIAPDGMTGVRPGTVDSSLKQTSVLACRTMEEEEEERALSKRSQHFRIHHWLKHNAEKEFV